MDARFSVAAGTLIPTDDPNEFRVVPPAGTRLACPAGPAPYAHWRAGDGSPRSTQALALAPAPLVLLKDAPPRGADLHVALAVEPAAD